MSHKKTGAEAKFRAFSDRTRLRILHVLLRGELCVCDIVQVVGVPQPKASRHLAYLRKAGLVTARRKGTWIHYSLAPVRTPLDRKLRECLTNCVEEVSGMRGDQSRLARLPKNGACC